MRRGELAGWALGLLAGVAWGLEAQAQEVASKAFGEERRAAVGKWPEGVAATGEGVWVAESGERKLALLDKDGEVVKRVNIGRLPVQVEVASDGGLVVLVATEQTVKRVAPKTHKVKAFPKLPAYAEDMVVEGEVAQVLLWDGDSSANSSVLRLDLGTGKTQRSENLGRNSWGVCEAGGLVWVVGDDRLSTLRADTLERLPDLNPGAGLREVACDAQGVYLTGTGGVVRVDAKTRQVSAKADIGGRGAAVAVAGGGLYVARADGEVWVLDPVSLKVLSRHAPKTALEPRALVVDGADFLMTGHEAAPGAKGKDSGTLLRATP